MRKIIGYFLAGVFFFGVVNVTAILLRGSESANAGNVQHVQEHRRPLSEHEKKHLLILAL